MERVLTARRVVSLKIIRVKSKSNKSMVNSIIYLVGFVYTVLVGVGAVTSDSVLVLLDEIGAALKAGDVKGKVVAGGVVEAEHLKGGGGAALVLKAVDVSGRRG